MVNEDSLDLVFHALADTTRRGILQHVAEANPTVGELGKPFQMSAPAISKHLKVLERSGLLTRIKQGKVSRFRLNPEVLESAGVFASSLEALWSERDETPEPEREAEAAQEDSWWNQEKETWMY